MKHYQIQIEVRLRGNIHDPQANVIASAIQRLGLLDAPEKASLHQFQVGKVFDFILESSEQEQALQQAEKIAKHVLSNPQTERYTIQVTELEAEK